MDTFKRDTARLGSEQYDALIIGGGISGAWLALHCQQAGLKTALIDRGDYAGETSSSSSKLLHGGIRYLQQFQFTKVRESAMERAEFIYAAPHLSTAIPFIIPTYPDFSRSKFFLNCGMLAYSILCLGQNRLINNKAERIPRTRNINKTQLNALYDLDDVNTGGVVFFERHMFDSERMVLEILKTAADAGATVTNYVNADSLIVKDSRVLGVQACDTKSGDNFDIKAKLVINAAGPWIDGLNGSLPNAEQAPSINGFALGSHIVTRQISDHAIAVATELESDAALDRGGRHVFAIPWRGYSLIGTSYAEVESCDGDLSIKPEHVDELLAAINHGLPKAQLTRDDLISGYSGLYPLRTDNIKSTVYQGTGEYQIIDHAQANKIEGLVTALGAKFTTGRKLSALTLKVVAKKLGVSSRIDRRKLSASQYDDFLKFVSDLINDFGGSYSSETLQHLAHHYGSDARAVLALADSDVQLQSTIMPGQPDLLAQVAWAVIHEQALGLEDVLFRRLSIGLLGLDEAQLENVATLMAKLLNWDAVKRAAEVAHLSHRLKTIEAALRPTTR